MLSTLESAKLETAKDMQVVGHFINGEICLSHDGKTFDNVNPATGQLISQIALGGKREMDQAIASAKEAFENGPWPRLSMKERCQYLKKMGDLILQYQDILAFVETRDTGKPYNEAFTGDIPRSASNFHFFADYAQAMQEDCFTINQNERHFAVREPLGVVGLITPWNLPMYLSSWKIAPALAMGNTVVLKPAEWTPFTAFLLGLISKEAGLPPGVFNVVHGFGPDSAGEALTRHPDVKAISFTGETTTGKIIMKAAADTLKKVSFELGGKGANILFEDANLDQALDPCVHSAFRNQGQICLAGSRLYVHESLYDEVVKKVTEKVQAIQLGDPMHSDTKCGPVIAKEHMDKVLSYMAIAREDGQILVGGGRCQKHPEGFYVEPTLVAGVSNDSRLIQEEIFGPLLPIVSFKTEDEVVAMVNDTKYGLSASVWSQDVNRCHRVSRNLQTGIVWINCWFARDLRTPFGGKKESGVGREGGRYSLEFFSDAKTICYRYE